MSAWQPIRTAPRDGTLVDLSDGENRYPDCFWSSSGEDEEDHQWMQLYAEAPGSSFPLGGDDEFTHWMPRPALP